MVSTNKDTLFHAILQSSKRVPHVFDFCENRRERKIFIRVFGRRGKEKCMKDNNKKLFYYFILINYKLIFNYEIINVISQNI